MPIIKVYIADQRVQTRFALTQMLAGTEGVQVVGSGNLDAGIVADLTAAGAQLVLTDISQDASAGIQQVLSIPDLPVPLVMLIPGTSASPKELVPAMEVRGGWLLAHTPGTKLGVEALKGLRKLAREAPVAVPTDVGRYVRPHSPRFVVAIGSSTGGPEALTEIVQQIPADFPAAIVIVQHMPGQFTEHFAKRLASHCKLPVKEAAEGDQLVGGEVLVAKGDYHLVFHPTEKNGLVHAQAKLTLDPPKWKLRPTVDNMMTSLAPLYGSSLVGVILTGMGEDGLLGMHEIKRHGGRTVVQNQETSVVYGMAQEVVKHNLADAVVPLRGVIPEVVRIIGAL